MLLFWYSYQTAYNNPTTLPEGDYTEDDGNTEKIDISKNVKNPYGSDGMLNICEH